MKLADVLSRLSQSCSDDAAAKVESGQSCEEDAAAKVEDAAAKVAVKKEDAAAKVAVKKGKVKDAAAKVEDAAAKVAVKKEKGMAPKTKATAAKTPFMTAKTKPMAAKTKPLAKPPCLSAALQKIKSEQGTVKAAHVEDVAAKDEEVEDVAANVEDQVEDVAAKGEAKEEAEDGGEEATGEVAAKSRKLNPKAEQLDFTEMGASAAGALLGDEECHVVEASSSAKEERIEDPRPNPAVPKAAATTRIPWPKSTKGRGKVNGQGKGMTTNEARIAAGLPPRMGKWGGWFTAKKYLETKASPQALSAFFAAYPKTRMPDGKGKEKWYPENGYDCLNNDRSRYMVCSRLKNLNW